MCHEATKCLASCNERLPKILEQQEAFSKSADKAGIDKETRKEHRAYSRLVAIHQELLRRRTIANEARRRSLATIQEAINFYKRKATGIASVLSP